MKAVLVGNYGVGNLGDEALCEYFLLRFSDVQWTVMRESTGQKLEVSEKLPSAFYLLEVVPRLPLGFRSFFTTPWWKTLRAIRSADVMVFGGGTLFTDVESVKACYLWWWHAFTAWILRTPILLTFQGIGPFQSKMGERLARWVVKRSAFISVRDTTSLERISTWKKNVPVVQTFDPILLQVPEVLDRSADTFVIIPRHTFDHAFVDTARRIFEEHPAAEIVIALFQPDEEQPIARSLSEAFQSVAPVRIIPVGSMQELHGILQKAAFVVSQRFHGSLAAMGMSIPQEIVPQGLGDKLWHLKNMDTQQVVALQNMAKHGEEELRMALENINKNR